MNYRSLLGPTLGVMLCASAAAAQVCQGNLPFTSSRVHLGGMLGLSDNTTSFGAGLTLGRAQGLYGGGSLGLVDYDGLGGSSFTLGGGIGYTMPLSRGSKVEICPGATVSFAFGPNDVGVAPFEADLSSQTLTAGASVGAPVVLNPSLTLLPFGSGALGYTHLKVSAGGQSTSDSDVYFVLGFGAGFQFSRSIVVVPGLTFPIGADGSDDVIFNIGVTFGLPSRSAPSAPSRRGR